MHDIDRTLAELAALDGSVQEADFEFEPESDDFENFGDFEFEREADFEDSESYQGIESESDYEDLENFGNFESEPEADFEDEASYEGSESESDYEDFENFADFEFEPEADFEANAQLESTQDYEDEADEMDETELAAELLGVQDEDELDFFLGNLLKKVTKKLGQAIKSPVGQRLVALLRKAAKKALPGVGSALGTALGGPAGSVVGGNIAAKTGQVLGLELEGLAPEDQELEAAKGFIRFAADAAQEAAEASPGLNSEMAARTAVVNAARRYAPGLLATTAPGPSLAIRQAGRGATGRWVRVSRNQILLHGI